jgi:hypothetical protein
MHGCCPFALSRWYRSHGRRDIDVLARAESSPTCSDVLAIPPQPFLLSTHNSSVMQPWHFLHTRVFEARACQHPGIIRPVTYDSVVSPAVITLVHTNEDAKSNIKNCGRGVQDTLTDNDCRSSSCGTLSIKARGPSIIAQHTNTLPSTTPTWRSLASLASKASCKS